MRGCSFADDLVTFTRSEDNMAAAIGATAAFDHGATFTGNAGIEFDIVTQPGGFWVTIHQFG